MTLLCAPWADVHENEIDSVFLFFSDPRTPGFWDQLPRELYNVNCCRQQGTTGGSICACDLCSVNSLIKG